MSRPDGLCCLLAEDQTPIALPLDACLEGAGFEAAPAACAESLA